MPTTANFQNARAAYAELNKKAVEVILELFEAGDHEAISSTGLSIETIERIRNLKANELSRLTTVGRPIIECIWDDSNTNYLIDSIQRFASTDAIANELIKLRAPINMMERLAGWARQDVIRRRKFYDIDTKRGRLMKLGEDGQNRVRDAWYQHSDLDNLQRCLAVYKATGILMDSAWVIIQECLREDSDKVA